MLQQILKRKCKNEGILAVNDIFDIFISLLNRIIWKKQQDFLHPYWSMHLFLF